MNDILFIGAYLSRDNGTKDFSERIEPYLREKNIEVKFCSGIKNRLIRLLHIILKIIFSKSKVIAFDVFSNLAFLNSIIGVPISKIRKKNVILTIRGGAFLEFEKKNPKLVNFVFSQADYIHTPSKMIQSYFLSKNYNIGYLPNAVDIKRFPYKRDVTNPFSILWVRAFDKIYNPEIAINLLNLARADFPKARLTMVGPDKGLLRKCKNLANKLGILGFIDFVGPVPNDELFHYYQSHSVYLNTTSYESFGNAILEAAACGIPILSSQVGEIPLLWQKNREILLVDSIDERSYFIELRKIFTNKDLKITLSKMAYKKSKNFSIESISDDWAKIINKLSI